MNENNYNIIEVKNILNNLNNKQNNFKKVIIKNIILYLVKDYRQERHFLRKDRSKNQTKKKRLRLLIVLGIPKSNKPCNQKI